MSNNKQGSVEWLVQELRKFYAEPWKYDKQIIIEQAKAMHESEIQQAFDEGNPNGVVLKTGEQYYNETFGGNK